MRSLAPFIVLALTSLYLSGCNTNPANTAPAAMTAHPIMNSAEYGTDASKFRGPSYQMPSSGVPASGGYGSGAFR